MRLKPIPMIHSRTRPRTQRSRTKVSEPSPTAPVLFPANQVHDQRVERKSTRLARVRLLRGRRLPEVLRRQPDTQSTLIQTLSLRLRSSRRGWTIPPCQLSPAKNPCRLEIAAALLPRKVVNEER